MLLLRRLDLLRLCAMDNKLPNIDFMFFYFLFLLKIRRPRRPCFAELSIRCDCAFGVLSLWCFL